MSQTYVVAVVYRSPLKSVCFKMFLIADLFMTTTCRTGPDYGRHPLLIMRFSPRHLRPVNKTLPGTWPQCCMLFILSCIQRCYHRRHGEGTATTPQAPLNQHHLDAYCLSA